MKNLPSYVFLTLVLLSSFILDSQPTNPILKEGQGYVEVEGGKIWYGIMGEGNNTPLLCMHGGPGGTSRSFYHLAELSKNRPVILFDQLGSGRSDRHQDTSLLKVELFVEQVKALRDGLELNEFYLVGSSWGTALALEYYTKYPKGVKGIIFNSPYFSTPIWTEDAAILVAQLPDTIQRAIEIAERDSVFDSPSFQAANSYFASLHGRRKEYIKHPYDTVAAYGNGFIYNYMWGPSEFTAKGTLKTYDNIESLQHVAVPTLFTTGEFDEARPETVQKLSQLVSESEFVRIPNAAHFTLNDNRPAVVKAMKKFLRRVEK